MHIEDIFADAALKQKDKSVLLGQLLLQHKIPINSYLLFTKNSTAIKLATCIAAAAFATNINASIIDIHCWKFIVECLQSNLPRVKWEAAKVVGNCAHLYTLNLSAAITNLLHNAAHKSTVVRWASAYALGQIILLQSKHAISLQLAVKALYALEENNGVKKKYYEALKNVKE